MIKSCVFQYTDFENIFPSSRDGHPMLAGHPIEKEINRLFEHDEIVNVSISSCSLPYPHAKQNEPQNCIVHTVVVLYKPAPLD